MRLIILSYLFNDWASGNKLLRMIDAELHGASLSADILLVDDGSNQPQPRELRFDGSTSIRSVQILKLRNNLGHQRAIAAGLSYIYENKFGDAVVIMDADGQDEPADIIRLVKALQDEPEECIIFAKRTSRSEGLLFTFFYHLYRWFFSKLTGNKIYFGNFSIVPFSILNRIVVDMNLWNHYAAAVCSSKLLFKTIPSKRGRRFYGKSKLNFTSLVIHGLSAMSCYNEIIATRLLFGAFIAIAIFGVGIITVAAIRLFTDLYIVGWATYTIGILTIIALQIFLFCMTFMFTLLENRKNQPFIPLRDYKNFIADSQDHK
jgi:glycosyltransferase involved in cell wall biosynthesis